MTPLIITAVRDQARAIRSFDLMPEGTSEQHGVRFVPGQVAVLSVADEEPAYFAFASAPEDRELEVLIKRKVGASDLLFEMQRGKASWRLRLYQATSSSSKKVAQFPQTLD